MKKLISISYTASTFNIALLIMRLGFGILTMHHGYQKVATFNEMKIKFPDILGIGATPTLCFVIFAELICAGFVAIGLFTRLTTIPLIIDMCVALAKAHKFDVFGAGQAASLFLLAYIAILLVGPGKYSADGMLK